MSEETRAAQFRVDHAAGARKRCRDRYHSLPGDPTARTTLLANWAPWVDPLFSWDPGSECDEEPQRVLTPFGLVARGAGREIP